MDYIIDVCNPGEQEGKYLLEHGVGCGDHLRIYKKKGFNVKGLDISQ